jgi:hypothetical protein
MKVPADPPINLIYLNFFLFHSQICFVVNRRGTPGAGCQGDGTTLDQGAKVMPMGAI